MLSHQLSSERQLRVYRRICGLGYKNGCWNKMQRGNNWALVWAPITSILIAVKVSSRPRMERRVLFDFAIFSFWCWEKFWPVKDHHLQLSAKETPAIPSPRVHSAVYVCLCVCMIQKNAIINNGWAQIFDRNIIHLWSTQSARETFLFFFSTFDFCSSKKERWYSLWLKKMFLKEVTNT